MSTALNPGIRFIAAMVATSVAFLSAFTWLLAVNRELYTVSGGAREHLRSNGIYLRSVWHDYYPYKLAMYQLRPTSNMSVGSSRAMAVRALLFRDGDHYSAGGSIQGIEDAKAFVAELKTWRSRPRTILILVDYAWFIDTGLKSYNGLDRARFDRVSFLYQSAFVHLADLVGNAFAPRLGLDPDGAGRAIGARAQRLGDGFRVDGSMRFLGFETGTRYDEPELYGLLAARSEAELAADARAYSQRRRWWGAKADGAAIVGFAGVLDVLKELGIEVAMMLPPVAPHLARALRTAPELAVFDAVMSQLRALAGQRGLALLDYTEIPMWDADCWVDRYHASEGAYAWMLRDARPRLAQLGSGLAAALDAGVLERLPKTGCLRSLTGLARELSERGRSG